MRVTPRQVIGFLLLCLVVGFALDALDVTPVDFWQGAWERVRDGIVWAWQRVDTLLLYIALGAAVVIPIYLILWLVRRRR